MFLRRTERKKNGKTHHYWNVRDECWVMRVSSLEGSLEDLLSPSAPLQWSTVYETAPCIGLAVTDADPVRFSGIENGGEDVIVHAPSTLKDGDRIKTK